MISVYIPTYNRVDLLRDRAVPSVQAQTHEDFECIVVAHGCTDGTAEYVNGLEDDRFRLIEIPRKREYPETAENHFFAQRVAPSNVGLKACIGDWIATLDDDDIWEPDCLESLLRFAEDGDYEFVSAGSRNQDGDVEPYNVDGIRVGALQTWLYRRYLRSFEFNKDCWRKQHDRVMDTDLQRRFREIGVRMGYLDKVLVNILPRPGLKNVGMRAVKEEKNILRRLSYGGG